MPSRIYELFREAILREKRVTCTYSGYHRVLCPIIIGHTSGEERVLAYQVGGKASKPLTPATRWKCLSLAKVRNAKLGDGPWAEGTSHVSEQRCVKDVDLDINIQVRKLRAPAK